MPEEQQWRTRLSLPVSYGVARTLWLRRGVSPRCLRATRAPSGELPPCLRGPLSPNNDLR